MIKSGIYNLGFDESSFQNLNVWFDITNKLGHLDSNANGVITINYNKTLSLIRIGGYFMYTSSSSGKRKIFHFNNDIPGASQATHAFVANTTGINTDINKSMVIRAVPYSISDTSISLSISSDSSVSYDNGIISDVLVQLNTEYWEQFNQYVGV